MQTITDAVGVITALLAAPELHDEEKNAGTRAAMLRAEAFVKEALTPEDSETLVDAQRYRQAAKLEYENEGTLEIDSNALVSFSDDRGAYVAAWVWVADDRDEEEGALIDHDLETKDRMMEAKC